MLQQMRSFARFVWLFVAVAFVGGFLLVETSGLLGRTPLTPTTPVAVVNGREIRYTDFQTRVQQEIQSVQQQQGRTLSQDDVRRIENDVFDQMVMEVLLQQEYDRRRITVTDDEVREMALVAPPNWLVQSPLVQTDGQFDPEKYQRLLQSPVARQQGILTALENYYRTEIPREKLFSQVASGVWIPDVDLWRSWRDQQDTAQVSFVAFRPTPDSAAAVTDAELRQYFERHREEFRRPGRAVLSVVSIPRVIDAADTAAARARAASLRAEIAGGAKFEDVARRESADTVSGAQGGDLGRGLRGRFVPEFETAAFALAQGEMSQPVLTPFGYHIIKVDERKGDTLALRHILVDIAQRDSAAILVDQRADSLATITGASDNPNRFEEAARRLGLTPIRVTAFEGEPAVAGQRTIPSVSAWAFGGAQAGDVSDLFDDETGYFMARVDSITPGTGETPELEDVREEVRLRVAAEKALDAAMPRAQQLAAAAATSSLEAAAAQAKLPVEKTEGFARGSFVAGLGQANPAVGAAFGLPQGAISAPVRTEEGVFVLRVDRRTTADSAAWVAQKDMQRRQRMQQLQQQRVQIFMQDLRTAATVEDRRQEINAAIRRQAVPE